MTQLVVVLLEAHGQSPFSKFQELFTEARAPGITPVSSLELA